MALSVEQDQQRRGLRALEGHEERALQRRHSGGKPGRYPALSAEARRARRMARLRQTRHTLNP